MNLISVAFLSIGKTWDDQFVGKVGGWEILRNGGDDFEMEGGGGDNLLQTMLFFVTKSSIFDVAQCLD